MCTPEVHPVKGQVDVARVLHVRVLPLVRLPHIAQQPRGLLLVLLERVVVGVAVVVVGELGRGTGAEEEAYDL